MNAFSYEFFFNFRMSFHLRVKSAAVLTIKTFPIQDKYTPSKSYMRSQKCYLVKILFSETHDISRKTLNMAVIITFPIAHTRCFIDV